MVNDVMNATSVTILALLASTFRFFVFVIFHRIRLLNVSTKNLYSTREKKRLEPHSATFFACLGYL